MMMVEMSVVVLTTREVVVIMDLGELMGSCIMNVVVVVVSYCSNI